MRYDRGQRGWEPVPVGCQRDRPERMCKRQAHLRRMGDADWRHRILGKSDCFLGRMLFAARLTTEALPHDRPSAGAESPTAQLTKTPARSGAAALAPTPTLGTRLRGTSTGHYMGLRGGRSTSARARSSTTWTCGTARIAARTVRLNGAFPLCVLGSSLADDVRLRHQVSKRPASGSVRPRTTPRVSSAATSATTQSLPRSQCAARCTAGTLPSRTTTKLAAAAAAASS